MKFELSIKHLLLTTLVSSILVACAPKSETTLADYSRVAKTLGPIHHQPSPTQTYLPTDVFFFEIDPTTSTTFIVGQRNVVRFRAGLNLPGTQYELVSRDLPRGSEPLKNLGNGVWEFTWVPSQDLIPQSLNEPFRGGFHVSLKIVNVSNPQSKIILNQISTEREITYYLLRSWQAPEVVTIGGVEADSKGNRINEGDVIKLLITVKDPSASETQKPRLVPIVIPNQISTKDRTLTEHLISGHGFFFIESEPELLRNGLWQFRASFDTKNTPVPEFNVDGVSALKTSVISILSFQVLSPNHTVSVPKTIQFEITYRRELLRPAFKASPETKIIPQGSTFSYNFESYLPSVIGSLKTYLSDETVKLPGAPTMTCKEVTKPQLKNQCRLEWKIPCTVNTGDVSLKIIAASDDQGQSLTTELYKKLVVSENSKCKIATATTNNTSVAPIINELKPAPTPKTSTAKPASSKPITKAIAKTTTKDASKNSTKSKSSAKAKTPQGGKK